MKTTNKENDVKMFSLLLPMEDYKLLDVIKKTKRFTTTQQAVKYLMYSDAKLLDFENITLSNNNSTNEKNNNK